MHFRLNIIIIFSLFLIQPFQLCLAAEKDSIVWVADGVSIRDINRVKIFPVSYDPDNKQAQETAPSLIQEVRDELGRAGIIFTDIKNGTQPTQLALKINIVHLQTGSVGGRWVGLGGGGALCILRTQLIKGSSEDVIGDIIVAKQVSTGGLFSAGAGKSVPLTAANQTAQELAVLLGVELKASEDELQ